MEGDLQITVGGNLRWFRRKMDLSQEAFGELVGWHRTFVGAVERGERNLTLRTVERIAAQIEVEPVLLLGPVPDEDAELGAPPLLVAADGPDDTPGTEATRRRPRPSPS